MPKRDVVVYFESERKRRAIARAHDDRGELIWSLMVGTGIVVFAMALALLILQGLS